MLKSNGPFLSPNSRIRIGSSPADHHAALVSILRYKYFARYIGFQKEERWMMKRRVRLVEPDSSSTHRAPGDGHSARVDHQTENNTILSPKSENVALNVFHGIEKAKEDKVVVTDKAKQFATTVKKKVTEWLKESDQHLERAYEMEEHKEWSGAVQAYTAALKILRTQRRVISNMLFHVHSRRGMCHLYQKQLDAAQRDFSVAIRIIPWFSQGYLARGLALMLKGEYKLSQSDLECSYTLSKGGWFEGTCLAISYHRAEQFNHAVDICTRVLEAHPDQFLTLLVRGDSYKYTMGNSMQLALQDYLKVLELDEERGKPNIGRGFAEHVKDTIEFIEESCLIVTSPKFSFEEFFKEKVEEIRLVTFDRRVKALNNKSQLVAETAKKIKKKAPKPPNNRRPPSTGGRRRGGVSADLVAKLQAEKMSDIESSSTESDEEEQRKDAVGGADGGVSPTGKEEPASETTVPDDDDDGFEFSIDSLSIPNPPPLPHVPSLVSRFPVLSKSPFLRPSWSKPLDIFGERAMEGMSLRVFGRGEHAKMPYDFSRKSIYLEFWFKAKTVKDSCVLSATYFESGSREWSWAVRVFNGKIRFNVKALRPKPRLLQLDSTTRLEVGKWVHVYIEFYQSTKFALCVNGVKESSSEHHGAYDICPVEKASPGIIAGSNDCREAKMGHFDGQFSDLRVWKHRRSEQELQDMMCKRLKGTEPSLLRYWKFDDGDGGTVSESCAKANGFSLGVTEWTEGPMPMPQSDVSEKTRHLTRFLQKTGLLANYNWGAGTKTSITYEVEDEPEPEIPVMLFKPVLFTQDKEEVVDPPKMAFSSIAGHVPSDLIENPNKDLRDRIEYRWDETKNKFVEINRSLVEGGYQRTMEAAQSSEEETPPTPPPEPKFRPSKYGRWEPGVWGMRWVETPLSVHKPPVPPLRLPQSMTGVRPPSSGRSFRPQSARTVIEPKPFVTPRPVSARIGEGGGRVKKDGKVFTFNDLRKKPLGTAKLRINRGGSTALLIANHKPSASQ